MNLVDSCGWLEYFADSQYADFYAPAIEDTGLSWSQPSASLRYSNVSFSKEERMRHSKLLP
jgi:hypothetical protein